MNYLDVYKMRAYHLGDTPQERAFNSGILEFRRYLKYNSHTQRNLLLEDNNQYFDGVILTDKEDDNRVSQILLVELGIPIHPGSLILWEGAHWIVYQSTTSSYQPHQKFYMVRCNYYIKWVDENGALRGSWIYLLGSKDSKIQDNFRTWHNMITPQPNKHINIILPHVMIKQGTEIMVRGEVWYLVDYDQASVPGIIFMSFTETNVNLQRDSIEESIANIDKLATWAFEAPAIQNIAPGEEVSTELFVLKDGIIQNDAAPTFTVSGNLTIEDGKVIAGDFGEGIIHYSFMDTTFDQIIQIGTAQPAEPMLIGDEKLRLTESKNYTLQNAVENIVFSISDKQLATISSDGNVCTVIANSNNKIGSVVLTAEYNGKTYTKDIQIIPLWQVI